MDDPGFIHPWHMNYLDQELSVLPMESTAFGESFNLSKPSMEITSHGGFDRPLKLHKPNIWDPYSNSTTDDDNSPNVLSFVNSAVVKPKEEAVSSRGSVNFPTYDGLVSQGLLGNNQNYVFKASHGAKRITTTTTTTARPHSHPQDHIIAERKRREKLSQRFIALSAIVPGLKKVPNSFATSIVFNL